MSSRSTLASLRTGDRIAEKYVVECPLAAGGMGEVWGAVNEATQAHVALKVVHSEAAGDETVRARLEQEARIGATLAHRHIVRVFDLVRPPDGSIVVVMELLRGESLADYMKRRRTLSAREAVAVLAPVLLALSFVHARGILHRDIKPGNIFLAQEPDGSVIPKLVDFGIAKSDERGLTLPGDVLGTPQYLAPERIRGHKDLDGRSDLFSVGAVLYELISGRPPFDGATASATLAAVIEQEPEPDPSIDPRLWLVIKRALGKRPYERHASADEMLRELLEAVGLEAPSTTVILPDVRAPSVPQRSIAERASGGRLRTPSGRTPRTAAGPSSLAGSSVNVAGMPKRRSRFLVVGAGILGVVLSLGLGGLIAARRAAAPPEPTAPVATTPTPVDEIDETVSPAPSVADAPAPSAPLAATPAPGSRAELRGAAPEPRPSSGRVTRTKKGSRSGKGNREEIGTTPGF